MLEPDLVADPDAPMTRTAHEASRSCVAPPRTVYRVGYSNAGAVYGDSARPCRSLLQAFEASYGALLRYVEQRVGNTADAADIVQETYVRLRAANQDEALGNPQAYVTASPAIYSLTRCAAEPSGGNMYAQGLFPRKLPPRSPPWSDSSSTASASPCC